MSQEDFAPRTSSSSPAPPKPRRLYQLPDDYTDSAADSPPPVLHVSKVKQDCCVLDKLHFDIENFGYSETGYSDNSLQCPKKDLLTLKIIEYCDNW